MDALLPASVTDCDTGGSRRLTVSVRQRMKRKKTDGRKVICMKSVSTKLYSGLKQDNPESPQISEEPEEHGIKLEEDLLQITVGVKAEEHSLLQEIPQSPQTKEEPEEVRIKHEEEPLPVCVKTEEWSLPQRQSEHREETQGEDISPESEGDTEHSSDHDQDEDLHLQPVSSETDDDGDDHHRTHVCVM
uniref:Uncharacterized protein n=1 Tax=Knipowitschia caucasica TaxID=637954 RepID=A0AAV2ME73_KNICA